MNNLNDLHNLGMLAEVGFIKEFYEGDELSHAITDKGKVEIREILKDEKTRNIFKEMLIERAKLLPKSVRVNFLNNVKEFLK